MAKDRNPWVWTEESLPPLGEKVIFLDVDDNGTMADIGMTTRTNDWEDVKCYWMHIPPLTDGGLLQRREAPETGMDTGVEGGPQASPEDGALAAKITEIMQQWVGANGGLYAIRGCAMEIASKIQGAAQISDESGHILTNDQIVQIGTSHQVNGPYSFARAIEQAVIRHVRQREAS